MTGLFFLDGVVGDVASVSPNHDEHDAGFIDETNHDWPENERQEEHQNAEPTEREIAK